MFCVRALTLFLGKTLYSHRSAVHIARCDAAKCQISTSEFNRELKHDVYGRRQTAKITPMIFYSFLVILKDVRAQKFPRTDFFKTLTAGRK